MSDTRLSITPGWNPSHPRWHLGPITPKFQAMEGGNGWRMNRKGHRFHKGRKNSERNLMHKIVVLRAKEALEWI